MTTYYLAFGFHATHTRRLTRIAVYLCSFSVAMPQSCPTAPQIVPTVAGSGTWGYAVTGTIPPSTNTTTTQVITASGGALQLSAGGNLVTPQSPASGDVYRMIVPPGGTPATTGYIGTFGAGTLTDAGRPVLAYPPIQFNPTLSYYKSGLLGLIQSMRTQIANVPQPRPLLAGQIPIAVSGVQTYGYSAMSPCVPDWGQGSPAPTCDFNSITVLEGYVDALARAGVQVVDWNLDVLPFLASAEYINSPGMPLGGLSVFNDCGSPYSSTGLPFNTAPPTMSSFWCETVAVDDQVAMYVQNKGMKLRLHPAPSNLDNTFCGNASLTTPEECWSPLYQAVATRWNVTSPQELIESFTAIHEPEGAWLGCSGLCTLTYWTQTNLETFFKTSRMAIQASATSTPVCFSVATDASSGEAAAYWYQIINDLGPSGIDCLGLDIYSNNWDPSVQMVAGHFASCMGGPGNVGDDVPVTTCNWTGGAYPFVQNLVNHATNKGFSGLRVNESNRPVWVPIHCGEHAAQGIYDNAYTEFLNDGTDIAWQDAFVSWAAAQGFASVSQFASEVWIWYDSLNRRPPVQYWLALLGPPSYLTQTTLSGQAWSTSAQHLTSLQGGAWTSGNVHLSH